MTLPCTKAGGVCTIRLYEQATGGSVAPVSGLEGQLRTVCPYRFEENSLIYSWVGETILQHSNPAVAREVGFLVAPGSEEEADEVSQIDRVLAVPGSLPLSWCAVEVQAVYFSGDAMTKEWPAIASHPGAGSPFPAGRRRPDYRSSGPKRLMPQLQMKVPSLRRWGKRMAVVVDEAFWDALGPMDEVQHVSNCDIAWFVVGYEEHADRMALVPRVVHLTTLERSVEGLTAGVPVSLDDFELRIRAKLGI